MQLGHLIEIIVGKLSWKLAKVPMSFLLEETFKIRLHQIKQDKRKYDKEGTLTNSNITKRCWTCYGRIGHT
jgi:hypothetical protein